MRHGPNPYLTALTVLLAVLIVACGSGTDPTPTTVPSTTAPSPASQAAVQAEAPGAAVIASIKDFTHSDLTVAVGTKVRWVNLDQTAHTSSSGEPSAATDTWDSGTISPGGSFSFTFAEPGTFQYFCRFHNTMRATITVTGDATGAGAGTAAPNPTAGAAVPIPRATSAPVTTVLGPPGTWTHQFGTVSNDYARGLAVDSSGTVYAVGWTSGVLSGEAYLGGSSDAILRKYDSDGNEIETRQFGTDDTDLARGVAIDDAGNQFIVGWTEGTLTGQTNLGRGDAFISKYDPTGVELWTRQFGTDLYDLAQDVAVDPDGNSYVVGWTRGAFDGHTNLGIGDSYVRKYDSEGNVLWTRQFGTVKDDFLRGVVVDGALNVYVVGWTEDALPGETSSEQADSFVRKYDSSGNELWTRQFGSDAFDFAQAAAVDDEGSLYVGGWTNGALPGKTHLGQGDAFIRKYDSNGNEVWTWQYGTTAFDEVRGLEFAGGDRLYAVGLTAGALPGQINFGARDAYVRSFDVEGNELGTSQFGTNGDDVAHSVALDDAGNLYVGGWTNGSLPGQTGTGGNDAFVTRMSGVLVSHLTPTQVQGRLWTRQFGTPANDFAGDVSVDSEGNLYVVGWTQDAFPNKRFEGGQYDAYLRKYGRDGTELWTREFGTPGLDIASAVTVDDSGNVYVGGQIGGDISDQTSAGGRDAFTRKYDADGTELWTRLFGTAQVEVGSALAVDDAGNVYVTGWVQTALPGQDSLGRGDAYVRKHDADGTEIWTRQFGTEGPDEALSVGTDGAGNVYVAGYVTGALPGQTELGSRDGYLRSYDRDGNELWTRQFGTTAHELVLDLAVDDAGNSYVVGYTEGALPNQTGFGASDAFVRKYDPDGDELWTRQFGTEMSDQALGTDLDEAGDLYVVGITEGALPGLTKSGGRFDAFVRKYDGDGNELSTRLISSQGSDTAMGTVVDGEGNLYVVGWTVGALAGQSNLGANDAYIVKMSGEAASSP